MSEPKNIVVFSDGTGNSSAKAQKTNVWRLFQALDQTDTRQLAGYDDGVGTSANKYLAALGGAFGVGLKRNVIDLYRFICRTYAPGDRIYGFGFSRGAFTIRVLVGLIAREGLVPFRSEEELIRNAAAAYRSYRQKAFPSYSPIVWVARRLRNGLLWFRDRLRGYRSYDDIMATPDPALKARKDVRIHFLGLWDTVEAYGMPVTELKRAIDKVFWPMVFGDKKLSPKVRHARHALSLDDERATFHPLLWDEVHEARLVEAKDVDPGRIKQVWFAGVHSNVGGGYPEDQLSLVTLDWIIGEATAHGLRVDPSAIAQIATTKSCYAKLYDSRNGIAAYYRYSPRRIEPIFDHHGTPILPIVHWSVLMRMTYGSDAYAPVTLPNEFWVLAPDGKLFPLEEDAARPLQADKTKAVAAPSEAAASAESADKPGAELMAAISELARPDKQAIGFVWDTVFWRRCVYVLTCALTIGLLLYPVIGGPIAHAVQGIPYFGELASDNVGKVNEATRGPVSFLIDALNAVIPSYIRPWKEALIEHPLEFFTLLIGIFASLAASSSLDHRIHYRARVAWNDHVRAGYRAWMDQKRGGVRKSTLLALALMVVGFVVAFARGSEIMSRGLILWSIVFALMLALQAVGKRSTGQASTTTLSSTVSLSLARWLREQRVLRWLFEALTHWLFPALFVLLLTLLGGLLLNRAAFDVASSAGAYCKGTPGLNVKAERTGAAAGEFHTQDMCWNSGLVLESGRSLSDHARGDAGLAGS